MRVDGRSVSVADYSATHARALALVTRKGAAVTFTHSDSSQADATGIVTSTDTTVVGTAVRDAGNPKRYERLSLIESEAPTLLFTPTTFGECPSPGDTCTWAGNSFVVRDVLPIGPNGDVIAASVVISR